MKIFLKYLDKLLKVLKTDRNTFVTYILTLVTAYFIVDRVVELLIMAFTGMSVSYWGPVQYMFAIACPFLAFFVSYASKFALGNNSAKISFFYTYCICLYVIAISMFVQWMNKMSWMSILSLPNYEELIMNFSHLIRPALSAVAVYVPLRTFYPLVVWLYKKINDPIFPNQFQESINDYNGVDLNPGSVPSGQYSYEINLCNDRKSGKGAKILEDRRFQTTLIVGPSGVGKTSMVMEPMIAQDLAKKYFFNEISKEMGYTALKTGIATLNHPYDNDYLNKNFRLDMLTPTEGKEAVYKAYMKKMIYLELSDGSFVYRNLGLTSMSPDYEHTSRVMEVAKAFNIPVHLIDPKDPNSPGLNPFAIKAPVLCALVISSILKSLFDDFESVPDAAFVENFAHQAVQNLVILLKVMYPKMHDGLMPSLEDLLQCFSNFSLVEEMVEELKKDNELAKEYDLHITYFEQNFYNDSPGKKDMQRYVTFATSQLDYLLRTASLRNIICNRHSNLDFAEAIQNGDIILFCSRATDIGGTPHKGFARFFLFSLLIAAENRLGQETVNRPLPHFLYIDEFDQYCTPGFADVFTVFRKLHVGSVISCQNISSIGEASGKLMQSLSVNSPTKLSFGNCTPEDYAWWEKEFGERREWVVSDKYDTEKEHYSSDIGSVSWSWKMILQTAKQQGLAKKEVVFKMKDKYGRNKATFGRVDYLSAKYKEPHKSKTYNFSQYIVGGVPDKQEEESLAEKIAKFDPKKVVFEGAEPDPVQTDTTDSSYFFNNADAISFNLNRK